MNKENAAKQSVIFSYTIAIVFLNSCSVCKNNFTEITWKKTFRDCLDLQVSLYLWLLRLLSMPACLYITKLCSWVIKCNKIQFYQVFKTCNSVIETEWICCIARFEPVILLICYFFVNTVYRPIITRGSK